MPIRRHSTRSLTFAVLALGALAVAGGTAIGGHIGPVAAALGLLLTLAALYLFAALAIRDRAWRQLGSHPATQSRTDRLAGRRVF